jgi:hypothetical protein
MTLYAPEARSIGDVIFHAKEWVAQVEPQTKSNLRVSIRYNTIMLAIAVVSCRFEQESSYSRRAVVSDAHAQGVAGTTMIDHGSRSPATFRPHRTPR